MKCFLFSLITLLFAVTSFSAGSVSETRVSDVPPQRITLAWTSALNGTVAVTSQVIRATLTRVEFYNGSPAPTNATYAVTLKNTAGIDVLAAQGSAVASNAIGSATAIVPGSLYVSTAGITNLTESFIVNEKLVLAISGVGTSAAAGKQGVVVIYGE